MSSGAKYYFPQLDAVRGLSFLAVYFFHAVHPDPGNDFFSRMGQFFYSNLVLSIDVFFILSSFLLTWLGMGEYKSKGNFSFGNYFIRRALRIWPLYFLLMIFAFVLVPNTAAYFHVPVSLPPAYYYLFFVSNFYLEAHVYFLQFLWTLAVEEQFYLLWGLCLWLLQKHIRACAFVLTGVSIGYTAYAIHNGIHHYFHTLTYLFDFSAGIAAAYFVQKEAPVVMWFKKTGKIRSALFFLMLPFFFILLFFIGEITPAGFTPWLDLAGRYGFIIYTALFIIEQMVNEDAVLKLKKSRFLVYTGKISYGLYCFHGVVLTFGSVLLEKLGIHMPVLVKLFVFLGINYLVAAGSYRFIESPFLQLKNKLRRI